MGEFGNKFRQAREKKELSLDDVSNVTKINSRMLRAIEEEHFDQLPGGVFNKGFIRAYAKHLGLNSEDAISDYLACLRQAQIDSHANWDASPSNGRGTTAPQQSPGAPIIKAAPKAQEPHPPEQVEELPGLQLPRVEHVRPAKKGYLSRQPSGPPWALIAVAALVVVLGIFLWIRHSRATPETTAKPSPPPVTAAVAQPTTSAPSPSTSPANPVAAPAEPQPTTLPSPAVAASQTTSAPSAPEPQQSTDSDDLPVAHPSEQASSTPAPADPTQVKVEKKGDVTIRSFGAATTKPPGQSAQTLTLVVRASENSWISVTSDGQLLTQETLIAPAATSFHASRELVVRVGNAAGVSFIWNGEEIPSQGAEAEAKTFIFDAQGMRSGSSPQPSPQN